MIDETRLVKDSFQIFVPMADKRFFSLLMRSQTEFLGLVNLKQNHKHNQYERVRDIAAMVTFWIFILFWLWSWFVLVLVEGLGSCSLAMVGLRFGFVWQVQEVCLRSVSCSLWLIRFGFGLILYGIVSSQFRYYYSRIF